MSALTNQFDADVAGIEPDLPVTFVWNGKTLTGSKDATRDSQDLADAGIIQLYDFELVARTALFAALPIQPAKNDEIQIQDSFSKNFISYRIDKITPSQDGVCLTYGCVQLN